MATEERTTVYLSNLPNLTTKAIERTLGPYSTALRMHPPTAPSMLFADTEQFLELLKRVRAAWGKSVVCEPARKRYFQDVLQEERAAPEAAVEAQPPCEYAFFRKPNGRLMKAWLGGARSKDLEVEPAGKKKRLAQLPDEDEVHVALKDEVDLSAEFLQQERAQILALMAELEDIVLDARRRAPQQELVIPRHVPVGGIEDAPEDEAKVPELNLDDVDSTDGKPVVRWAKRARRSAELESESEGDTWSSNLGDCTTAESIAASEPRARATEHDERTGVDKNLGSIAAAFKGAYRELANADREEEQPAAAPQVDANSWLNSLMSLGATAVDKPRSEDEESQAVEDSQAAGTTEPATAMLPFHRTKSLEELRAEFLPKKRALQQDAKRKRKEALKRQAATRKPKA